MATQSKQRTAREILKEYIPGYPNHNHSWSGEIEHPDPKEAVAPLIEEFKTKVDKLFSQNNNNKHAKK